MTVHSIRPTTYGPADRSAQRSARRSARGCARRPAPQGLATPEGLAAPEGLATPQDLATPQGLANSREAELRGFLIMATHDLKSPLTTVSAHLQLLREEGLPDSVERDLDVMERAVRRMTRLIEDLLTHARADQSDLKTEAVSLDDLVAEVTDERLTTDDGSRVTAHGPLPQVQADPALLRHVIDNLIGNALKYQRPGTPAQVEVSAHVQPDSSVRVEVADNGIGIPEADRPKVFDAFHRCTNSRGYQGTGVGLAICHRIIERHGGRIGVTESPAGGSAFWFTLPAVRPTNASR